MLHFRTVKLLLAWLILPSAGNAVQVEPAAAKIHIGGSGGPLGTMQILGDDFKKNHPQVTVVIVPSLARSGGIRALQAGAIDVAHETRLKALRPT